jgi:hypothetical protein
LPTPLGLHPITRPLSGGAIPVSATIVAVDVNMLTLLVKRREEFRLELAQHLDVRKEARQEAEEEVVAPFSFAGEHLFIKPHGAGKQ